MPTSNERRALWFLALVALSGSVVRLARSRDRTEPSVPDAGLQRQLGRVDSARVRRSDSKQARSKQKVRPDSSGQSGPLDLDRASVDEIEALPGIGPSLAARIVAHRDSGGPFRTVDRFCDVKGVGPALVSRLKSKVTFSGESVPSDACKATLSRSSESHVTNRGKRR